MTVLERAADILARSERDLAIEVFRSWDRRLLDLYRSAEVRCFPPELLYTEEELVERGGKEDFEAMITFRGGLTASLLILYRDGEPGFLYLDTLAAVNQGSGLGRKTLAALISAGKKDGWKGIELDTERINHRGQRLVAFYEKSGFAVTGEEESGNIHMVLEFGRL
ncbi:MAG: GNAT family N-acetyltransferase [Spirochaetales bacterium]|nr:GNAT family N-acetyltransferase [Spirochaetales bacterium]